MAENKGKTEEFYDARTIEALKTILRERYKYYGIMIWLAVVTYALLLMVWMYSANTNAIREYSVNLSILAKIMHDYILPLVFPINLAVCYGLVDMMMHIEQKMLPEFDSVPYGMLPIFCRRGAGTRDRELTPEAVLDGVIRRVTFKFVCKKAVPLTVVSILLMLIFPRLSVYYKAIILFVLISVPSTVHSFNSGSAP